MNKFIPPQPQPIPRNNLGLINLIIISGIMITIFYFINNLITISCVELNNSCHFNINKKNKNGSNLGKCPIFGCCPLFKVMDESINNNPEKEKQNN